MHFSSDSNPQMPDQKDQHGGHPSQSDPWLDYFRNIMILVVTHEKMRAEDT